MEGFYPLALRKFLSPKNFPKQRLSVSTHILRHSIVGTSAFFQSRSYEGLSGGLLEPIRHSFLIILYIYILYVCGFLLYINNIHSILYNEHSTLFPIYICI